MVLVFRIGMIKWSIDRGILHSLISNALELFYNLRNATPYLLQMCFSCLIKTKTKRKSVNIIISSMQILVSNVTQVTFNAIVDMKNSNAQGNSYTPCSPEQCFAEVNYCDMICSLYAQQWFRRNRNIHHTHCCQLGN